MANVYDPTEEDLEDLPLEGDLGEEEDLEDTFPDDDPPEPDITDEQRARAMGWKPREEYRGPPERWTDYPEFLRKGEEELPVLRDQNRRMSERLVRAENTIAEQREAIDAAMSLARKANDVGYQRALDELKAKQKEAFRDQDEEAFDQLGEQIDAMEKERAEVVGAEAPREAPPAARPPAAGITDPVIADFVARNASWFNDPARPELRQAIAGIHTGVMQERGEANATPENVNVALNRFLGRFPAMRSEVQAMPTSRRPAPPAPRRDDPPRRRAPSVEAPSGPGAFSQAPRRGADPFMRISDEVERADARRAYTSLKRQQADLTPEAYVSIYLDPHADELERRRQSKG